MNQQICTTHSAEETELLGERIGEKLRGGEVIELKSDLGGGKTTFTRGLARGFGSNDTVASPSFTISYVYSRPDKKELHHFDFYRLSDGGVVASELAEVENDPSVVVVVEWGDIVHDILPSTRVILQIRSLEEDSREITIRHDSSSAYLFEDIGVDA